ncbi:MAG TPA: helix-turn-helix transcriptional regulator [Armatimonadota bacterium]
MNGSDIKRARETAGVNQQELADALGLVNRSALTDIESGAIEVAPGWALKAIGIIDGIRFNKQQDAK